MKTSRGFSNRCASLAPSARASSSRTKGLVSAIPCALPPKRSLSIARPRARPPAKDRRSSAMAAIFLGLGANGERQMLELATSNRHGLIAGATGTGKTVTLQGLAEDFSAAGVPVFLADVKGDLSGIAMPGSPTAPNA